MWVSGNKHQPLTTQEEATSKEMEKLESAILCNICNDILLQFHVFEHCATVVELSTVGLMYSLRDYVAFDF